MRSLLTALGAIAALLVAAAVFAFANYADDAADQSWQYDVGWAIVRYGVWVLVAVGVATVIVALRRP